MGHKARKFINRTGKQLSLPDKRGGQLLFKPGDFTFDQWYARCAGRDGNSLTVEEASVDKQLMERIKNINKPSHLTPSPITDFQDIVGSTLKDRETKEYTLKKGIYRCKLCGLFRTGSLSSLESHISNFHKEHNKKITPPDKIVEKDPFVTVPPEEKEKVLVTTRPKEIDKGVTINPVTTPDFVEKAREKALEGVKQPPLPVPSKDKTTFEDVKTVPLSKESKEEKVSFVCNQTGCTKSFSTKRGLTLHLSKSHGIKANTDGS